MTAARHAASGETWTVLYRGVTATSADHVIYRLPGGEIGECSGGLFDYMTRSLPDADAAPARGAAHLPNSLRLRLLQFLWDASLNDPTEPQEAARLFDALAGTD